MDNDADISLLYREAKQTSNFAVVYKFQTYYAIFVKTGFIKNNSQYTLKIIKLATAR